MDSPKYPTIMANSTIRNNAGDVVPAPPVHQPMLLGPSNTETVCQFCHAKIKTAVKHTTTTRTHMLAFVCHFVCCCCCIPYCCDSARNSDHYCPNCDRYLGTYEK